MIDPYLRGLIKKYIRGENKSDTREKLKKHFEDWRPNEIQTLIKVLENKG